ncbi:hypothetical protein Golob_021497, partial [Gossypium lobatum]|nr:hypothetical protein [Gossypium lobatum]
GYFGGYLLAAVGIGTKSDNYLIAYVVVESENEASLCWFLELLLLDLEIVRSYKISFMFNKQKGLVEKICLLFPNAETRNCVRHLHQNFKKVSFKTKALKNLLWKAARGKNLTHWLRSHFSLKSKSDMLVNNLCECFNKMIFEARGKPILTMMQTIRTKIMFLIVNKKEAGIFKRNLCSKIKKNLAANTKDSISCFPSHASGERCQVKCGLGTQHVVDLVEHSCAYNYYAKETQLAIYSIFIRPIRCPKYWEPLPNMLSILSPLIRRSSGRPTKIRRKEPDEPQITTKLTKKRVQMKCSKCKKFGHNKRSYRGEVSQNPL